MVMSSHIRMRCSICGKQYQIERKLFCYYAADQIFFLMQLRHIWNNHRDCVSCMRKFVLQFIREVTLYVLFQIWDIVTGIAWLLLTPFAKLRELLRWKNDKDQRHANTANRHDPARRWCSGSVSVAQGLQTSCLLGCGSGSECDSDILTQSKGVKWKQPL